MRIIEWIIKTDLLFLVHDRGDLTNSLFGLAVITDNTIEFRKAMNIESVVRDISIYRDTLYLLGRYQCPNT